MKKCIIYLWKIIGGRNEVCKIREEEQCDKIQVEDKYKPIHSQKDLEDIKKNSKRRIT